MVRIESYMHRYAKQLLREWLLQDSNVVKIELEKIFIDDLGNYLFVPDLTVYNSNGIWLFIEVFHKHEIDGKKILEIQKYCYYNNITPQLIEISAYWILSQVKKPDELKGFKIKLT